MTSPVSSITSARLERDYQIVSQSLIDEIASHGHWEGELSSSALSTATAIVAMELVERDREVRRPEITQLILGGLNWLASHQNPDGGWGDTVLSHSNISTSTLGYSAFFLLKDSDLAGDRNRSFAQVTENAKLYMDRNGGFDAIKKRYGKDHTFSVPILTQCALAGLIPWNELIPLPFELGSLPHRFYQWIKLPVVSYALPALIAIGQTRHFHAPSWNPLIRLIRNLSVKPTLRRLIDLQPESGGFLEATPLTSFVTMSLASMKLAAHPVAVRGLEFIKASVRPDGSWPIDTNLATWVTTLSVNSLKIETLKLIKIDQISSWLSGQQHRILHRYTNAAPGGWAWTDLSGGVPDADDTPGAILAMLKLAPNSPEVFQQIDDAVDWLLDLQNSDGGWPTFCRGWGALPFDRSSADLTAHALRALHSWKNSTRPANCTTASTRRDSRFDKAVRNGFRFLEKVQRSDGAWIPLWFGNQFITDDENPVYGTAKVLGAYREWGRIDDAAAIRAVAWLESVQNADGGWGGGLGSPSSIEETSLALDALLSIPASKSTCRSGLEWLLERVEDGRFRNPSPIGLYFAKLWYFERLYPIIFATAALNRASSQWGTDLAQTDVEIAAKTILD